MHFQVSDLISDRLLMPFHQSSPTGGPGQKVHAALEMQVMAMYACVFVCVIEMCIHSRIHMNAAGTVGSIWDRSCGLDSGDKRMERYSSCLYYSER